MSPSRPARAKPVPSSPADPRRRVAVKAAARYAAITGPALLALALPQPAWASHDQGKGKSTT